MLIGAATSVYSNSLLNQFLLDDHIDLFGSSGVAHKSYLQILTQPQGSFFRPLGPLFYKTCYLFFQENPLGYQIANLLLFICIIAFFYAILIRILPRLEIAFLATLLYAHASDTRNARELHRSQRA